MCTLTNQISYHILHYCSQISTLDGLHIVKGRVTGLKLNSMRPPLKWSPGHIQKGEAMIFIWKTQVRSAGFEPRMLRSTNAQSLDLQIKFGRFSWTLFLFLCNPVHRLRHWANSETIFDEFVVYAWHLVCLSLAGCVSHLSSDHVWHDHSEDNLYTWWSTNILLPTASYAPLYC